MAKRPLFNNGFQKKVSCEEALKNVSKIKVGIKEPEILKLLGTPTAISQDNWSYNFLTCARPKIGAQIIVGIGLLFKEKAVSEIGWATICAMGVPTQKTKKKKS